MTPDTTALLARWSSRSGKHWVELYETSDGAFTYTAPDCGGTLGGPALGKATALHTMQAKVDSGYFQTDANKTPMRRVF